MLAILTALMLFIGHLAGGMTGLAIAFVFAIAMNTISYFFGDKMVLAMYKAKPAPKDHKVTRITREVSRAAGIPMPKVFIIPIKTPNAFACGRSPSHSSIAFTEGIIGLLDDKELKGVAAHELAHVKNRDILISTIAATIAGVIGFVASTARYTLMFGRDDDNQNIIGVIVIAIVAPIIATLIQLAISRSREFLADERGAAFLKDSVGLASALEKLESGIKRAPLAQSAAAGSTAHLFIASPFRASSLMALFMTHPPMEERIARLRHMKF